MTLLGNKEQREKYWLEEEQAFVFDRRAHYFQPIFDFYQSGNAIQRTELWFTFFLLYPYAPQATLVPKLVRSVRTNINRFF